jgi:DNA-directed RNA polymerase subunit M/transcription elongation factor TFIIS
MVSNKTFFCETCGYSSNRKYNLELHKRSPNACEKRINRLHIKIIPQNVNPSVNPAPQNVNLSVNPVPQNVNPAPQNVNPHNKNNFKCEFCDKELGSYWNLKRHIVTCKKADSLQCPTCKKTFTSRQGKYKHENCEM